MKSLSNSVTKFCDQRICDEFYVFRHKFPSLILLFLVVYGDPLCFLISILGEFGVADSWTRLYGIEPLPEVVEPIGVVKNRDIFYLNIDEEVERLVLKKDMNVVKWLFIMKVFFQSEKYIYS
ncbi:hypothetical protein MtrunA17_Chr7g0264121 [Medicago truncatula]|uniref:Transmembrane protein n=1 Tax=Medicago truncatula TaxID=3880 RepID=A0A396H5B9_MEDTR|nr:hypothetical protein MtrunA17_Chr7g0264121 [Medicago truncatula]